MVDPTTIDNWMAPYYSAEVYGFLTEPDASTGSSAGTVASAAPNIIGHKLECQIESSNKFDCTVEESTKFTGVKNPILLKDFLTRSDAELEWKDIESSLSAKKLYKIQDTKLNFKDGAWKTKSIKVFDASSATKTELGSIMPMFMFQGRAKTFVGTTHSFVGQASEELLDNSPYKCSWTDTSQHKDCTITPFVANDDASGQSGDAKITDLKFTKDSTLTANKKIIKHHYYLIQFTDTSDSKELKDFVDTEIIYAKDSTSSNQITFGKLSAVTVVEDQLLILK